jgi:hypothetical protein
MKPPINNPTGIIPIGELEEKLQNAIKPPATSINRPKPATSQSLPDHAIINLNFVPILRRDIRAIKTILAKIVNRSRNRGLFGVRHARCKLTVPKLLKNYAK